MPVSTKTKRNEEEEESCEPGSHLAMVAERGGGVEWEGVVAAAWGRRWGAKRLAGMGRPRRGVVEGRETVF